MNPKFFKIYRCTEIAEKTKLSFETVNNWKNEKRKNVKLDAFYKENLPIVEKIIELKANGYKLVQINKTLNLKLTRWQFYKM